MTWQSRQEEALILDGWVQYQRVAGYEDEVIDTIWVWDPTGEDERFHANIAKQNIAIRLDTESQNLEVYRMDVSDLPDEVVELEEW